MRLCRIVCAVALMMVIVSPLAAQEKQAKKRGPSKLSPAAQAMLRLGKMHKAIKGLDLTDEQKEKLKKLHEANEPKMKEVFTRLTDVLTEEQRSAAEAAVKEAKEANKEDREVVLAAQEAAKITDEQKKKTDKIGQEMLKLQREMLKSVAEILTPEQQQALKKAMRSRPGKKEGQGKKKKEDK